jgi:hypothetical protein
MLAVEWTKSSLTIDNIHHIELTRLYSCGDDNAISCIIIVVLRLLYIYIYNIFTHTYIYITHKDRTSYDNLCIV